MTNTIIRPIIESDLPALFALDHLAVQEADGRREVIRAAMDAQECVTAVYGETVVGYAILDYTFFGHGFIPLVYVHADYRQRKIGQALVSIWKRPAKPPNYLRLPICRMCRCRRC